MERGCCLPIHHNNSLKLSIHIQKSAIVQMIDLNNGQTFLHTTLFTTIKLKISYTNKKKNYKQVKVDQFGTEAEGTFLQDDSYLYDSNNQQIKDGALC